LPPTALALVTAVVVFAVVGFFVVVVLAFPSPYHKKNIQILFKKFIN
jgi:hypothetical protein